MTLTECRWWLEYCTSTVQSSPIFNPLCSTVIRGVRVLTYNFAFSLPHNMNSAPGQIHTSTSGIRVLTDSFSHQATASQFSSTGIHMSINTVQTKQLLQSNKRSYLFGGCFVLHLLFSKSSPETTLKIGVHYLMNFVGRNRSRFDDNTFDMLFTLSLRVEDEYRL